ASLNRRLQAVTPAGVLAVPGLWTGGSCVADLAHGASAPPGARWEMACCETGLRCAKTRTTIGADRRRGHYRIRPILIARSPERGWRRRTHWRTHRGRLGETVPAPLARIGFALIPRNRRQGRFSQDVRIACALDSGARGLPGEESRF